MSNRRDFLKKLGLGCLIGFGYKKVEQTHVRVWGDSDSEGYTSISHGGKSKKIIFHDKVMTIPVLQGELKSLIIRTPLPRHKS